MQMLMNSTKDEAWEVERFTRLFIDGNEVNANIAGYLVKLACYDTFEEAKTAFEILIARLDDSRHCIVTMPSQHCVRQRIEEKERRRQR